MDQQLSPTEQGYSSETAKLYVWLRGLEGKVNNLLREMDLIKNDFIKKNAQLRKEMKTLSDEFTEIKHEQQKMTQKMDLVIKELGNTAGMEDVQVLKKYIDLWNPLNFVTQRDVERIVETKLQEHQHSSKEHQKG